MIETIGIYAGICWNLAVCFCLPAAGIIFLQRKNKRCVRPFLLGAGAFLVSQVLLRMPLIGVLLSKTAWYLDLQMNHPGLYWIFLGMTAGLFEETARTAAMYFFMKKNRRPADAAAFGLGHGGIEAALLTGLANLNLLVACIIFSPRTASGIYGGLSFGMVCMGGLERLLAILMHMEWSVLTLEAVKKGRAGGWIFWALAVLLHGCCDASIGFLQAAGVTVYALEGIFGLYVAGMGGGIWLYVRMRRQGRKRK